MIPDNIWLEAAAGEKPLLHWLCPRCNEAVSTETEVKGFESDTLTVLSMRMPKDWLCVSCKPILTLVKKEEEPNEK